MPVPYVLAAIGSFLTMTASRVVSIVAGRKFTEQSSKGKPSNSPSKGELVRRDERSRQAEIEYQRGRAKREQELVKIQADLAKMREIEIKAGMEIAAAQAEREERSLDLQELRFKADMQIAAAQAEREERSLEISERTLQLKKQELELAKARLRQEGKISEAQREQVEHSLQLRERELQLMAEELTERRKLSYLYLDLMREKEAKEIELKLTEIQAKWDRENWSGILSREEMRQILVEGQKKHRLLMLVSPPDISEDCPRSFRRNLQMEVRSELKEFIERHYPFNSDLCPVEFYGKFFKHSVFDIEAKQLERDLDPVSTVIIYSDITDQKIYFHISFWGLLEPISLTLPPWNWAKEKEKLEAEGNTETASFLIIRQSIVKIHQLLAAFLADLYYLNINPTHDPHLFQLEDELPPGWVQTHFDSLREIQQQKIEELNRPKYKPIERFKR